MTIRPFKDTDTHLLEEFLYLAVHQADPNNPIPRSVIDIPQVINYISGFGTDRHDYGLVAEIDGIVSGIVWVRLLSGKIKGFGYVDDETPEFAISILDRYRGLGVGTSLMNAMLALLKEENYTQCSLSVEKSNRAINLYKRLGFKILKETKDDYIMIKKL